MCGMNIVITLVPYSSFPFPHLWTGTGALCSRTLGITTYVKMSPKPLYLYSLFGVPVQGWEKGKEAQSSRALSASAEQRATAM